MKKWLLPLVFLALFATGAAAERIESSIVDFDEQFAPITTTFKMCEGDSAQYVYGTAGPSTFSIGLADSFTYIVPSGVPAWLNVQFETEATTLTAWFRFKEFTPGESTFDVATYTWGDWVPIYLGGEYRSVSFNCGLWESCAVRVIGSGDGLSNLYWFAEVYRD